MIQKYSFFEGGTIEFDDNRTVKELIEYAFDTFDYYEPLGMDIVTLFQAHHPETNTGWFTRDVELRCADEIKNPSELCFAYYMPEVFYFSEGGWGDHMTELENRPHIPNAVSMKIRFEDFNNTVVINGDYCFMDIIRTLQKAEYISENVKHIRVLCVGNPDASYLIPVADECLNVCLTEFMESIKQKTDELQAESGKYIYHEILEIV